MKSFITILSCVLLTSAAWGQSSPVKELSVPAFSTEDIKSTGPNGEPAVSATKLELTDEDRQKLKDGHFKVAMAFHMLSNEMNSTELVAMKDTFTKLGVNVVGVTDAQMKVEQQVGDIESSDGAASRRAAQHSDRPGIHGVHLSSRLQGGSEVGVH